MTNSSSSAAPSSTAANAKPVDSLKLWQRWVKYCRDRILEGIVVVLPITVSLWIIHWIYATLRLHAIEPVAVFVLWKTQKLKRAPELPYWFETYAAPLIAAFLLLGFLFVCGLLAHSRFRAAMDRVLLQVPIFSRIYDAVRNVLKCFDAPSGEETKPQRIVLVPFPHPGMRLPAIVTSTCRDISTQKPLLCVYVPTTPVPTSGFFLMIPEEEVTELNWDVQQTLQAIISGGLSAPSEVTYYANKLTTAAAVAAASILPEANPLSKLAPGRTDEPAK